MWCSHPTVNVLIDTRTDLGESPTWDARTYRLYFCDINKRAIHVWEGRTGKHYTIEAPEMVGTVALTTDEDVIIAALHRTLVLVHVKERKFGAVLATVPEAHGVADMRFNDGKGSPGGDLIVGRMHSSWRNGHPGRLYRADLSTGGFEELLSPEEVVLPNGMAWNTEKRLMYFVDTAAYSITAYRTDEGGVPVKGPDGRLSKASTFTVSQEDGAPDGMTIDRDGNLWVALAEGSAVACYCGDTGRQLRKVALPVKRVTACTFGGPRLEYLFVTTRVETGADASENWGTILSVEVPGVAGAASAYPVRLPAPP